jgi:hypothetical protein
VSTSRVTQAVTFDTGDAVTVLTGLADLALELAVRQAQHGVLTRAWKLLDGRLEWPPGARMAVLEAVRRLTDSAGTYADVAAGEVPPSDISADLGAGPDGRREALRRVAEDVARDTGELVRVIAEHIGEQAAEEVRGEDGVPS